MSQSDDYFKDFTGFYRDLKIWLLTYGIGAPVVFLTNSELFKKIESSKFVLQITLLFLFGAFLQIVESFCSKWASWIQYSYVEKEKQRPEGIDVGKCLPSG